jgi:hypothetical protein
MFRPTWHSSGDTHHIWNAAVYNLERQLPVMTKLLKKFYSVYFFFERSHLLTYAEPDESNSNSHTASLSFVLILCCPVLPKKNFIIVTGYSPSPISCVTYHTGTKANLIILLPLFSANLTSLSLLGFHVLYIPKARPYINIFWLAVFSFSSALPLRQWSLWGTRWGSDLYEVRAEAVISVRYALRQWSLWGTRWGREKIFFKNDSMLFMM